MNAWQRTMEVKPDGSVTFPGIDMSNGSKPMLIVQRLFLKQFKDGRDDIIVVRHPGGSCWSGIGRPPSRVAVSFHVFKIVERLGHARWRVEEIVDFPARLNTVATNIEDLMK